MVLCSVLIGLLISLLFLQSWLMNVVGKEHREERGEVEENVEIKTDVDLIFTTVEYTPFNEGTRDRISNLLFAGVRNNSEKVVHGVEVKLVGLVLPENRKRHIAEKLKAYGENGTTTSLNPGQTKEFVVAHLETDFEGIISVRLGKQSYYAGGAVEKSSKVPFHDRYAVILEVSSNSSKPRKGVFSLAMFAEERIEGEGQDFKLDWGFSFGCARGQRSVCQNQR